MIVAQLLQEFLALLQGTMAHFVAMPTVKFTQMCDGEWSATGLVLPKLTAKGNSLVGALADIILYGATQLDFIMQVLAGTSIHS